jgi:hypothetical protein
LAPDAPFSNHFLFAIRARCAKVASMLSMAAAFYVMTEYIMKKLATLALVLGLTASTATAGGYVVPVIEAEPVVVGGSSSNAGLLIPAILLVGLLVAVASSSH